MSDYDEDKKRLHDAVDAMFAGIEATERTLDRCLNVVRAAKRWEKAERNHTYDANCAAGDHDDCPDRESVGILLAAISALDGDLS